MRKVFWYDYAKILRYTRQNAVTERDFTCILARDCEGTEQLRKTMYKEGRKSYGTYKSSYGSAEDGTY